MPGIEKRRVLYTARAHLKRAPRLGNALRVDLSSRCFSTVMPENKIKTKPQNLWSVHWKGETPAWTYVSHSWKTARQQLSPWINCTESCTAYYRHVICVGRRYKFTQLKKWVWTNIYRHVPNATWMNNIRLVIEPRPDTWAVFLRFMQPPHPMHKPYK